jgi:NADH:ubiquinone oxidoreductase subunit 2 (subunit N)
MFMREPRSEDASLPHGRLMWGGLVVASVLTVALGLIPGPFLDIVGQAARAIGG